MTSDEASNIAVSVEKIERTLNVRGIPTHIFEAGSPAPAPLLYLRGGFGQKRTFKELIETGVIIVGSVDTVIEKLSYYTDVLHAGMLVTGGHIGEIPDYLVLKNQELLAKEVMPHFREQVSAKPADQPAETLFSSCIAIA